jgi:hypothetical protein
VSVPHRPVAGQVAHENFTVSGRVTDGVNALANVEVDAVTSTNVTTTRTDSTGHYAFANLAGTYMIRPVSPGQQFNPARRTLSIGSRTNSIDFQRGPTVTESAFTSYADYALADTMAGGQAAVTALLAAVPLIMMAGYAIFALAPVFTVLVVVYAVRRITDYAITRPCRDSLFTVVSREEKYQAKSLIDTFAYRGGDAVVDKAR